MLQSAVKLAHSRPELMEHFLRAFSDAPWDLIAGGTQRSFAVKQLPKAVAWIAQQQGMQRNVFAPLPNVGGHVWHLAVRAPFEVRPAEFRFPPSLTIVADGYWLLWRANEPMKPRLAKILSERMAKDVGGREAVSDPVPLPGTVHFTTVGAQLQQRFPVQMLPALATAYRIIDGELVDVRARLEESPFVRADLVEEQPVAWLWRDMFPTGSLGIIMGDGGMGKSQIGIDIAARVTSGAAFPGTKEVRKQASAIVLETEDDVASVTIPRLRAAGADMRKVLVHGQAVDLSQGVDMLETEAKRLGDLRLLVISPMRMFFGDVEAVRQIDTRTRLAPLLSWAATRNVAVIGIAHLDGGSKGKRGEDMAGPKAFAQRARAVHSAVIDESDDEPEIKRKRRLLINAKISNAPDTQRLAYRIISSSDSSRIKWL